MSNIQEYRKKPVIIKALQWNGSIERRNELTEWLGDKFLTHGEYNHPSIKTLEGDHLCNIGDYVIRGVKGEFYPCKPDIFAMTYEKPSDLDKLSALELLAGLQKGIKDTIKSNPNATAKDVLEGIELTAGILDVFQKRMEKL